MDELVTVATGLAASAALGLIKAGTDRLDARLTAVLKPFAPALVTGLSIGLPLLGNAVGLSDLPPADVVANAPVSAVAGIVGRELAVRLARKVKGAVFVPTRP